MYTNYCDDISISDRGVNSIRSIPGGWIVCLSELAARAAYAGASGGATGGLGAIIAAVGARVVLGMVGGAAGVFGGGSIPAFCCEVRMRWNTDVFGIPNIFPDFTFHNFRRQ